MDHLSRYMEPHYGLSTRNFQRNLSPANRNLDYIRLSIEKEVIKVYG